MRKTAIALLALGLVMATTAYASNAVRISQIYGGGGGGTSNTYKYDYVELFNNSGSAVDISGWQLQYGSATGSSFGSSSFNYATVPASQTIPACGYYLIRCGSAGSGGADLPVTPDFAPATINVSATTGKFVLTKDGFTNQPCADYLSGGDNYPPVDLVGWATANCYETAAGPGTDGAHVLVRGGGGMTDNDNNSTDFTSTLQPYAMHNSSMTNADCIATPTQSTTWGRIKTIYK